MNARLSITLFFIFIELALNAQTVYNPNIIPLGDKEPLMANTGTGGLESSGAVYYNPAALTQLKGNSFSLSGSAYMRYRFSANPIAVVENSDLNYEANGFQTIPTSVIGVRTFKKWHFAFSFLVPMEFQYEGRQSWNINVAAIPFDFTLLQNYREKMFWGGLSAARRINEKWSWGVSLYAQQYTYLSHTQLMAHSNLFGTLTSQTERVRYSPLSALVIGGLHRSGDRLNLGLRLSMPSIPVLGKGDYYRYAFESDLGGTSTTEITDESDLKTRFVTPLDVRLGITYLIGKRWNIAVDGSFNTPQTFDAFPDVSVATTQNIDWSFRVSAAVEYKAGEKVSLHLGTAYTPSTVENPKKNGGLDFYSLFVGGKLRTEHIETSVGVFTSLGYGEADLEDTKRRSSQYYEYLGLFLGTNYKF